VVGSMWFSAWIDAGQPDMLPLLSYQPSQKELEARRQEIESWRAARIKARPHEGDD